MANGVRLDLVTDTSQVKKGLKDVEDAFEDVGDTLDKIGKEGEDVGEDLERSFSDLAKETKKEARAMANDVGDSYKKMDRDAGKATEQMANDAASEAEQVASSFDGSAESIVDGFQGAAASMFSGFGPAGAAAGLAAAAGLGLISAELEKQKEQAAEVAEATDEMVAQMLEAGSTFVTEQAKLNMLEAFLGDAEQRKEAEDFANKIGVPIVDFASAMFGLAGDRERVEKQINDYYYDQLDTYRELGVTGEDYLIASKQIKDEQQDALDLLEKQDGILADAEELAEAILGKRKEITGQIREEKDVTDELSEDYRKMALIDATPKLNIEEEANRQVAAAQRALNSLRAPDLTVRVRTVR